MPIVKAGSHIYIGIRNKNELTTETYVTKICEFVKHGGTQDRKLKVSRASTQPGCVMPRACPNHLLEFAVSGYLAKAFVIYVLPRGDLGGKAESVIPNQVCCAIIWLSKDETSLLDSRSSLQVNQNACAVLVQVWYDYRSKSPETTHASCSHNDDLLHRQFTTTAVRQRHSRYHDRHYNFCSGIK